MERSRYAELFRTECAEHLAEVDRALLALEANGDVSQVATLFRSTHTIKGMAGAMGYAAVERIAHGMESVLAELRSDRAVGESILEQLFSRSAALRQSVDAAVNGGAARESAIAAPPGESTSKVLPLERYDVDIAVQLRDDCPLKGVRALIILQRLATIGAVRATVPDQSTWQLDAFDGQCSISMSTATPIAEIESMVWGAGDVARVTCRRDELFARRADDVLRTVRIDLRRLDGLLDLVSELVIARDRLVKATEAVAEHGADRPVARAVLDTARLVGLLQEQVLQARMVPVGQVFDRYPRLVRDVARELGKEVAFSMEGREIEVDRSLLDAIGDPIVHLLRNALDHGLEDTVTRCAAGKSPAGRLLLRATRDRGSVVLQVEDDGRGIDRAAILRRALADGLVPDTTAVLDDDALLQVLARAGFSTATAVTALSGRGVGVDVVVSRVRALAGSLTLSTAESAGTTFTIRLPVTLAIMRVLLVQVADEIYAFPAGNVVEALEFDPGSLGAGSAGAELATLRNLSLPVVRLRTRFGLSAEPTEEGGDVFAVVVEAGGRRSVVLVDALIGQQDIVVKRFDAARAGDGWFSGATVLGDGRPALIVDLGSVC